MFYKCITNQHGGRDKLRTDSPFPIIVYFFLLLGGLQLFGEGETWLRHGSFPLLEKAQSLCNRHQVIIQV
jgi:hypothetical protein